jgi:phospholipid/cholesterol/gamma-HCH transport system substrate-binding protein
VDYFRSGIKVALLFIASCLVLTYFVLHAGQVRVMGDTQDFKLLFSSVGNLKLDSPVTYSGFKVGEVVKIRPLSSEERRKHERDVEVRVRLSKDVVVRKDSEAQIQTLGFLGEKYIEISPGGLESLPLEPDEHIYGRVPQDISTAVEHFSKQLDDMLPTIKNTLQKLNSTVERADQVIQEIANEKKIQKLLDSADQITKRY